MKSLSLSNKLTDVSGSLEITFSILATIRRSSTG